MLYGNASRELWTWSTTDPSGAPFRMLRGKAFAVVGGVRRQTPDDPNFPTEAAGRAWVDAAV